MDLDVLINYLLSDFGNNLRELHYFRSLLLPYFEHNKEIFPVNFSFVVEVYEFKEHLNLLFVDLGFN